jgi:hypothetical protein
MVLSGHFRRRQTPLKSNEINAQHVEYAIRTIIRVSDGKMTEDESRKFIDRIHFFSANDEIGMILVGKRKSFRTLRNNYQKIEKLLPDFYWRPFPDSII